MPGGVLEPQTTAAQHVCKLLLLSDSRCADRLATCTVSQSRSLTPTVPLSAQIERSHTAAIHHHVASLRVVHRMPPKKRQSFTYQKGGHNQRARSKEGPTQRQVSTPSVVCGSHADLCTYVPRAHAASSSCRRTLTSRSRTPFCVGRRRAFVTVMTTHEARRATLLFPPRGSSVLLACCTRRHGAPVACWEARQPRSYNGRLHRAGA